MSPQDPAHTNAEAGNVAGDNDPVDVVEIGAAAHPTGAVVPVRPRAQRAHASPSERIRTFSLYARA